MLLTKFGKKFYFLKQPHLSSRLPISCNSIFDLNCPNWYLKVINFCFRKGMLTIFWKFQTPLSALSFQDTHNECSYEKSFIKIQPTNLYLNFYCIFTSKVLNLRQLMQISFGNCLEILSKIASFHLIDVIRFCRYDEVIMQCKINIFLSYCIFITLFKRRHFVLCL